MRILIIGGTGLISTAITRELRARGDEVMLFNRGQRALYLDEGNVAEAGAQGLRRILGDRHNYAVFEKQMGEIGNFDAVIDMICFLPEDAESAIRAFKGKTGQYIFCSTVDAYTKPTLRYPIREDAPRAPRVSFPYAFHKAECERLFEAAHARGDLKLTIIRPAHTYGEGSGLIHSLGWGTYYFDRLRKGQPIITHGDGTSFWASCHRDDVGHAFVGALGNTKAIGRPFHTAADDCMTWNQYHECVASAIGAPPPKLVHIPTDLLARIAPKEASWCAENFSYNNMFDNAAARNDLGFRQTISLTAGVQRIVAWLDKEGKIESSAAHPYYDRIIESWERSTARLVEGLASLNL